MGWARHAAVCLALAALAVGCGETETKGGTGGTGGAVQTGGSGGSGGGDGGSAGAGAEGGGGDLGCCPDGYQCDCLVTGTSLGTCGTEDGMCQPGESRCVVDVAEERAALACLGGIDAEPQERCVFPEMLEDWDCDGASSYLEHTCEGCTPNETRACFPGPIAYQGLGSCSDGIQTCQQDGTWGSCAGGVGPTPNDCDNWSCAGEGTPNPGCACRNGEQVACAVTRRVGGVCQVVDGTASCANGELSACVAP
jgi:hypothetical protein